MSDVKKDKGYAPDDDRPWTEEQWEAFMKESDLRTARFGELFETMIDDPDRHEKINREMGWSIAAGSADSEDDDFTAPDDVGDAGHSAAGGPDAGLDLPADTEGAGEKPGGFDFEDEDDADTIEAYRKAMGLATKVVEALQPLVLREDSEARNTAGESDEDEDVAEAYINPQIATAKIAGGHGMGYDDEVLCGNIVNCKRALEANRKGRAALQRLRDRGSLPAATLDPLLAETAEVGAAIEHWIAELRAKVWW